MSRLRPPWPMWHDILVGLAAVLLCSAVPALGFWPTPALQCLRPPPMQRPADARHGWRAPKRVTTGLRVRQTPGGEDYYRMLGVSQDATGEEIRARYVGLAKKLHPDVSQDPADKARYAAFFVLPPQFALTRGCGRFQRISEAYGVLSDQASRSMHDQVPERIRLFVQSISMFAAGRRTLLRPVCDH